MKKWVSLRLCIVLVAYCFLGCGSGSQGVEVPGTVKLDGEKLELGMVMLEPAAGGEAKTAQIQPDGTFRLFAVPAGKYQVAVRTSMYAGAASAPSTIGGKAVTRMELPGKYRPVPQKYEGTSTSGLTFDVASGKSLDLDLKSGP